MNINHQNNQNISFGNVVYGAKAGYNKYMLNKVDRPLFKNIEKSNTHVLVVTEKGASLHPQVFDKKGNAKIYNQKGSLMYSKHYGMMPSGMNEISLKDFIKSIQKDNNIYFLIIETEKETLNVKFIH